MNDEFWRLENVVFNIAPGSIAYGSIRLPNERSNVAKLATFQVEYTSMLLYGIVLVVDHSNVITVLERAVVIKRSKAREVRAERRLPNPPIKAHDIRMIFRHQFRGPRQPIVGPSGGDVSEIIVDGSAPLVVQPGLCWAVERGVLRVVHIRSDGAAGTQKEIVLCPMR